jgi:hypothetical protein
MQYCAASSRSLNATLRHCLAVASSKPIAPSILTCSSLGRTPCSSGSGSGGCATRSGRLVPVRIKQAVGLADGSAWVHESEHVGAEAWEWGPRHDTEQNTSDDDNASSHLVLLTACRARASLVEPCLNPSCLAHCYTTRYLTCAHTAHIYDQCKRITKLTTGKTLFPPAPAAPAASHSPSQ